MKPIWIVAVLVGVGAVAYLANPLGDRTDPVPGDEPSGTAIVTVAVPAALSEKAQTGKTIFDAKCAVCHGMNAAGQAEVAPPLVHKIYEPSHHGDESFQRAVALGVRGHHWPFGNMPPVAGLTRAEVAIVVSYVRALQRENGIN